METLEQIRSPVAKRAEEIAVSSYLLAARFCKFIYLVKITNHCCLLDEQTREHARAYVAVRREGTNVFQSKQRCRKHNDLLCCNRNRSRDIPFTSVSLLSKKYKRFVTLDNEARRKRILFRRISLQLHNSRERKSEAVTAGENAQSGPCTSGGVEERVNYNFHRPRLFEYPKLPCK